MSGAFQEKKRKQYLQSGGTILSIRWPFRRGESRGGSKGSMEPPFERASLTRNTLIEQSNRDTLIEQSNRDTPIEQSQ